jgi:ABC-type amino acid transport substrate-binding protein
MKNFLLSLIFATAGLMGGEQTLVVGTTSGYAPYVSLNASGQYEGFDIEFAEELGKKLGKRVVLKDCGSMPALLIALQQKKVDALIWAISITPEREKKMDMIYYQGEQVTKMPLLFWKKVPEKVLELTDLQGYVISVEASSFQENVLKNVAGVKLKQVEKILDGVMEIRYGKSQAVMADPSIVPELVKKHPEIQVVQIPLPPGDCSSGNGICINRDNPELAEKIRQAVQELCQEGQIQKLEKKWGLQ